MEDLTSIKQWIENNCKFAVYQGDIHERGLTNQPPLEMRKPLENEDHLSADIENSWVGMTDVFKRLESDVENLKEAVAYAKNPQFPTFLEAYQKSFGDANVDQTMMTLDRLGQFAQLISTHPKFIPQDPIL